MPDPVKALIEDHNRLRRLFKGAHVLGGHQSAEARAKAISELLAIHSALEEELIYPAIRVLDPSMADKAEAEHKQVDGLVATIRGQNYADNADVKRDLDKLEREVESHARWEEDNLLPRLADLAPADVDRIGRAMYERRQQLLKEHPEALDVSAETEGFIAAPRI